MCVCGGGTWPDSQVVRSRSPDHGSIGSIILIIPVITITIIVIVIVIVIIVIPYFGIAVTQLKLIARCGV